MYYEDQMMFHGFVPRVMGTRFDLLTSGTAREVIEPLWSTLEGELFRLEKMLNRFDPDSEVSACNSGRMEPGGELAEMIRACERYKVLTRGYFDISKGKRATIDLGGFAKGYVLRIVKRSLDDAGIGTAFVDFGQSSIFAAGAHPLGGDWKVSLTNPYDGTQICEIALRDMALSVSGNTPSYSGHIVDPHNGRALTDRRLVAVRSADPLDAEVLSTALMLVPEELRKDVLSQFEDVEAQWYEL